MEKKVKEFFYPNSANDFEVIFRKIAWVRFSVSRKLSHIVSVGSVRACAQCLT
jgi:hypothetical protein